MQEDPSDPDGYGEGEADGPPPLPGLFKRAGMVLYAPGDLFAALGPQPAVAGIIVLSALLTAAAIAVVPGEAFGPAGASADELPFDPAWIKIMVLGAGLVGSALTPFVFTVISWVAFRVVRRDEATFGQHLAVNAHALFIGAVGAVCMLPVWLTTLDMESQFTFASLLPFLSDGFLYDVLSEMQLFHAWVLAVASLGLSSLDPRRTWGSTALVLVAIWIAVTLAGMGIGSALGSAFSSAATG